MVRKGIDGNEMQRFNEDRRVRGRLHCPWNFDPDLFAGHSDHCDLLYFSGNHGHFDRKILLRSDFKCKSLL